MPRKVLFHASVVVLVILACATMSLRADDGVVLINQSKVIAAGGFPYHITSPGSYRLAGNLTAAGTDGIDVAATPVSIDLNGFSISGSTGSGNGVNGVTGSGTLAVANGTIRNFNGGININTTNGPITVHDVTIVNTPASGFASFAPARLTNLSVSGTNQAIICDSACLVQGSSLSGSEVGVLSEGPIVAADNVVLTGENGFAIEGGTAALLDNSVASNSSGTVTGITALVPVGMPTVVAASRNVFNLPGGTCLSGPVTSLGDNVCNGTKQ